MTPPHIGFFYDEKRSGRATARFDIHRRADGRTAERGSARCAFAVDRGNPQSKSVLGKERLCADGRNFARRFGVSRRWNARCRRALLQRVSAQQCFSFLRLFHQVQFTVLVEQLAETSFFKQVEKVEHVKAGRSSEGDRRACLPQTLSPCRKSVQRSVNCSAR